MSLHTITPEGIVRWSCLRKNCQATLSAHFTDPAIHMMKMPDTPVRQPLARRLTSLFTMSKSRQSNEPQSLDGYVLALPHCPLCGRTQDFLKVDYTIEDILDGEMFLHVFDEHGNWHGSSMKLTHACNFRILHMLYALGKVPVPPLVPVLPFDLIQSYKPLASFPVEVVDAFWIPYALFGVTLACAGMQEHMAYLANVQGIRPLYLKTGWQIEQSCTSNCNTLSIAIEAEGEEVSE